jgi:PIN domain nuclease of toxin-antitoxin system
VIVLDTHAWLWWVSDPDRLSQAAQAAIESADSVGVSAISCWEVAMLHLRGRIALDRAPAAWVNAALGLGRVEPLVLDARAAVEAALLEEDGFPGDPADRMIFGTARSRRAPLATKDRALRSFDPAGTVW